MMHMLVVMMMLMMVLLMMRVFLRMLAVWVMIAPVMWRAWALIMLAMVM